ncbi:hypothetical protein [Pleionea sediminis]|uniref:hypothetical protein n=1 Tax=Pleionea sediminis TaxID=2569479 RepID=UPI001185340F|nr:hypothetical protein [Pleionea sediminis]
MNISKSFTVVVGFLFLSGCMVGNKIDTEITPIGESYSPTRKVDIYFGEFHEERKYEQIAFLRVRGKQRSRTPKLIERIKLKAQSLGADAVINLETTREIRREGSLALSLIDNFSTSDDPHYQPYEYDEYNALVLTGVAIKYIDE